MKTLYTATLALILLFVPFAKAQWTQTNGPYANSSVLCFATDGTNLFAGTQNSGIYLSTDFGANWILKSDGLNFQSVRTMLINGSNIYTATAGGLYLSSDNGANWTFKLSGGFYSSSSLVVNGTTFIAASNGGIYRSTNGGANWTSVSGALLNATLAVVGNNFIAATSSGVYKSTDDGITWNLVNNTLTNVQAFKASGTNLYAGTTGSGVYLSTDYGSTWTAKNTGLTNLNITSFEFNGTDLYAGCSAGVFNTSNSGVSWTAVNSGIASTTVNALAIMGAQIFAGTNNTGVYQTGNFGASWTASNTGLVTSDVRALSFNGSNLFAGSNGTGAFLTSSSGANWNGVNSGLTNQTINAIGVNGINTFAGTNNGMFLTTNNGATWTQINSGLTNTSINDIAVSGSSIYAATNGGVFLSTNNGTSWTAVNTGLTGTQVQCLTINGSNIFAGIPYQGIFLSTNNGTSWTAVNTGLPTLSGVYTIYSLVRIGTNIFTAIGANSGGGVYKTINNGSTWTYANNSNAYELGVSGTNLFAFAYGASISTDSGSTWSNINSGLPTLPHYGFASNGSTIFLGSTGLGVWKRQLNEILCSVNPPVMSSVSANTICSGQSVNIALTNTGVAATYSWIATDNQQTTGESTTLQTTSTLNNTITNGSTTSATTVAYTITPTGISGGCAGTPQTVNILVNPAPVMTSNSSLTICSGQSVGLSFTSSTASSYSWIASNNTNITGESTTAQSSGTLNDILTNTSTTPQIVTYTVTPTATVGNCAGTVQTVSITVNPKPSMTSAAARTICSNGTVNIPLTSDVASNYTWIASDNSNTIGESTFLQSPGTLSNTIVNNTSVAQTITYTVTPTAIVGGCTNTQTVTVTVNPAPVMTSSNSTSLCSGNTLGLILTSNIASSYSWIASDNPNTSGESVTQQSSSTLNNTLTNNSSIAQTIYYSVTPTSSSAGCAGSSQSVAVTVNPLPTMTSSNSSSICSGNVVSIPLSANIASSFSWIATDNTNTTGESTSAQSSSTLSNTITNSTALQQTVTYAVTPTSTTLGNCLGTPQTVTVTVNPKPSMTSASAATICSGGTVNIPLTSNVASTYTWVATNNTNTVGESITLQSASALSNVITNSSTTDQNVVYTITPTSASGGCVGSSQTVTVIVKPIPSMTNASSATICSGSSVSVALSSNIASSYTWIAADNPNINGESIVSQSTSTLSNTLINNSTLAQNVLYTVTPTSTSGSCTGVSQTVTVVVNPVPTVTSSSTAIICSGGTVNIPFTSSAPSDYSWVATDNSNTTGESTTSQVTSTLNNTIINNSATVQNVVYTVTPTAKLGGCVGAAQTLTVVVNPTPTMTSASTATICSGSNVTISLTSNIASGFYWTAADNVNTSGESTTSQSNGTLSNTISNNSSIAQNVVYTVTPTTTNGNCVGTPQTVTVTVNPAPVITNSTTATICSAAAVTIPLTSSVASSFSWVASDNPNTTGESTTAQSTSTLNNTITNNSSLAQNVIYTVTPTSTTGSCVGVSQTVTVVVNPVPAMTSSNAATICSGGSVAITLSASTASSFSWIAANNANTTGESITAQSSATLNNTIISTSTAAQNVVYTVTPTAALGGCTGTSQTITVVVNPKPTMTSASSATICSGGSVNIPLTSNIASTYSWTAADNLNTTGESTTTQSNGALNNTIINNSATAKNVIYSVTPTSTAGSCVGTIQTVTVTVNPLPTLTNNTSSTICSAGAVTIPLTSNVASSFSWVASDNPNTTGESITTQTTSTLNNTITNNSSLAQNVIYTITPTSTTGSCVGASQTVTVVVNPVPVMTSLNAATICSGGSVAITLSASTASSFSWIAANNANTTGESITAQSSATLNNTIISTSTAAQNVVYTVTPTATLGGCTGTSQTVTVVVNPKPTMTSASSATICSGGSVNISLTSNIASTYSWIAADNLNTTGESTTAQSNGTLNNAIINNSATAKNVIYSVTPTSTAGTCVGTTQTVTVTVNPAPTITNSTSSTICSAGAVTIPLTSNVASSFSWVASDNPNTTGESTTAQSTSTLNNIITNNSSLAQNVIYTITPTSTTGSCVGGSQTVTVVVNPVPAMTSANSATLCSGENVAISLSATASSSFSWIATDNANTTGESTVAQSTNTLINTIINNSTTAQSVVYTIIPTATVGGCVGASQMVTVLVNPLPMMTSAVTTTICSGASVNITLASNIASSYSWVAADNVNTTGESTTSQFSGTLNNTIINNSTASQNIVYTVTPISSAGNCAGSPQTVIVTVNPAPAITNLTSATICSGDTVSIPLLSNISSTFTWIANDNANTTGESINQQSADTLQDVITNNSSIIQTVAYTVTPSSGNGCSGNAQTINVQVNPNPIMTNVNTVSVCSGNAVNISLYSNASATYTWVALDNINTTGESLTLQSGSVLNNTITNDSSLAQNVIYTVTPTATFGGCAGLPQNITVTVNPAPTITSTATDTICSGTSVNILFASDVSSNYSWSAINNSNTTGESISSQSASSITNTITNNSSVAQNVVYSVTPTSTVGGCVGADQTVVVTVDPAPVLINASTTSICSGSATNIILSSNINSTYSWVATDNLNTTGESLVTQTNDTLRNTIINTSNNIQNVVYTVTPTSIANGCVGGNQTLSILVNPLDNASFSYSSATFCHSGNNPTALITGVSDGTFSSASGLVFSNSNNGLINLSGSTLGTYTITYNTNGTCNNSSTFDLTITDAPSALFSYTGAPYCSGDSIPLPLFDSGSSAGVFSANPSGLSFVSTVTGEINSTASLPGTYMITNTIVASGGCASDVQTYPITINPLPVVSFSGLAANYYYNDGAATLTAVPSGGTFSGMGINGNLFSPAVAGGGNFSITYSYTDGNGCSNTTPGQTTTVVEQPAPPSICEVTVDDSSHYNVVYWDKTNYTNVDSFIVYREITNANYQRVGALEYAALSEFTDTVRALYFPNTGDPNAGTYRYKLQIRDANGNYSPLSPYHNTIYINQTFGTFTWNYYQIEGQTMPLPSSTLITYDLYRDDNSNGNWHIVNSVAGTQLTQTDIGWSAVLDTTARWRILTNWNISCTPTRQTINTSRSNIKHGSHGLVISGIKEHKFETSISIYPNPANDKVIIEISDTKLNDSKITLYNIVGENVYQEQINSAAKIIDVSSLAKGIYSVCIENSGRIVFKKLVLN